MNRRDIYWADVPYEDDPSISKKRPVIIAKDSSPVYVLTFKVTSKDAREYDPGDYPLMYWKESGLRKPSVVRLRRISQISPDKIGDHIGHVQAADVLQMQQIMQALKNQRQAQLND